jgi:hypothetical protein
MADGTMNSGALSRKVEMSDASVEYEIARWFAETRRRHGDGNIEIRVLHETLECPSTEEIEAAKSAAARTGAVGKGARCAFCRISFHENGDAMSIIKTGFCEACKSLLDFGTDQRLA